MKKLPELNVSFEEFYRIFFEPVRAKIMMTGLELKIFVTIQRKKQKEVKKDLTGVF